MYVLDIEALNLGNDVRSVGLDLVEGDENREPVRGSDAARIWTRVLSAAAGQEPWVLDFFSHIDRVRDFCDAHQIGYREATQRSIVVPAPEAAALESLLGRFEGETFGLRAGGPVAQGLGADPSLESELARAGLDAYQKAFARYFFCGVCGFEDGSLVLLSEKISAGEVIRRVRPALKGLEVQVPLPA